MELVRKQTYITPEQDAALKRIAARDGRSEADVLREVLDNWLLTNGDENRGDPLRPFIGWFSGSRVNDHDDIYR